MEIEWYADVAPAVLRFGAGPSWRFRSAVLPGVGFITRAGAESRGAVESGAECAGFSGRNGPAAGGKFPARNAYPFVVPGGRRLSERLFGAGARGTQRVCPCLCAAGFRQRGYGAGSGLSFAANDLGTVGARATDEPGAGDAGEFAGNESDFGQLQNHVSLFVGGRSVDRRGGAVVAARQDCRMVPGAYRVWSSRARKSQLAGFAVFGIRGRECEPVHQASRGVSSVCAFGAGGTSGGLFRGFAELQVHGLPGDIEVPGGGAGSICVSRKVDAGPHGGEASESPVLEIAVQVWGIGAGAHSGEYVIQFVW